MIFDDNGTFEVSGAQRYRELYFPIASEYGLKSSVTPNFAGDAKLDQNHFLYEPVSSGDIVNRRFSRNFWVVPTDENSEIWSAMGSSTLQRAALYTNREENIRVRAGYMWQESILEGKLQPIRATAKIFIPVDKNMEIISVTLENTSSETISFYPYAAVPLYGRSADNIRDHRHVTSLLHRVKVEKNVIEVNPTLSFDERGHQLNDTRYFAYAMKNDGETPESFFVNQQDFIGEGGDFERPVTLLQRACGVANGYEENGQEALGGFRFGKENLPAGACVTFYLFCGICYTKEEEQRMISEYPGGTEVEHEFERTKQYWLNKVNVTYKTGDENFDRFMDWVSFQPELRRLFGCSFLPHHDYGKGGRGWRDLWQDCLALLLMNPGGVRQMLVSNFAGVRLDGTNATIIGEHLGEFKADRNSITRVWMDHGVWPFMTTKLYIDQTGDLDILSQEVRYFKDRQVMRGLDVDKLWNPDSTWQMDARGKEYHGTVLEHLLLQNLTEFWEVGEHGHLRLRDADWNDALDMAGARGESVAFSNAYAANLMDLADLIEEYGKHHSEILLLQEIQGLLRDDEGVYDNIEEKQNVLKDYAQKVKHLVSGNQIPITPHKLAENLRGKGRYIQEHIRATEWKSDPQGGGWFNSYYDNDGNALDRIMLTGQVFAIMGRTAAPDQIAGITEAADRYLYDENCGGYRLNTDYREVRTNMGRMFGFAFGEKENGAVFSHMAVMYANALYARGFVKEGYRSLNALYQQSMNFERSHEYPGIPEYFGRGGRGLYHYLTGAASWYMLTVINQMFGVRGELGNLVIEPKLLAEQFDEDGIAAISLRFAGHMFQIRYESDGSEYGDYQIAKATLEGNDLAREQTRICIPLSRIERLDINRVHKIVVSLHAEK